MPLSASLHPHVPCARTVLSREDLRLGPLQFTVQWKRCAVSQRITKGQVGKDKTGKEGGGGGPWSLGAAAVSGGT